MVRDTAWEGLAAFHRRQRRLARRRQAAEALRLVALGALAATLVGMVWWHRT